MTKLSPIVGKILNNYSTETPGVKNSLARILMHGKLGGTGKMVILPVDQGFEHGPARSFAKNPAAYDPLYHFELAVDAGLNAYAAPLGMLEIGADQYGASIPMILKKNSANSLSSSGLEPAQAITASIDDALYLGCAAVGFTMYPGSDNAYYMMEEIQELSREAKSKGLAVVLWSYPRGGDLDKDAETAVDTIAYAAHMAALMGANIIKVKPPANFIADSSAKKVYESESIKIKELSDRIKHVMQCCFDGKRLVVFSGGGAKEEVDLLDEIKAIRDGGGSGSIIGRNTFQRPKAEALALLDKVIQIYQK